MMTNPETTRRGVLLGAAGLSLTRGAVAAPLNTLRVGTQKGAGLLVAAQKQRGLETLLNPQGIDVRWAEFPSGPPMLEAMRAGAIDIGLVGDTPPIFAQAARGELRYVATIVSGASAILLPAGSTSRTLKDLKGKRVAFARGSSAHNLTVAALEKVGLTYQDIQAIPLAPADAAAAFERGDIDAWTIWDPYVALYQDRPGVRVLAEASAITPQLSFFMASRSFVEAHPDILVSVLKDFARIGTWSTSHQEEVAHLISAGSGLPYEPTLRSVVRAPGDVLDVTDEHLRLQQEEADRFLRLGVIPARIEVKEWLWRAPGGLKA